MKVVLLAVVVGCASKPPASRVEIQPLPSHEAATSNESLDDLECKPPALAAVEIDRLNDALASARDFAQRCCSGDESGDATVRVTASPTGYQTQISIDPDRLAAGATGACVYATFHRVLVKPFEGAEKSASVVVRLR